MTSELVISQICYVLAGKIFNSELVGTTYFLNQDGLKANGEKGTFETCDRVQ